jgi:hypothetical protein
MLDQAADLELSAIAAAGRARELADVRPSADLARRRRARGSAPGRRARAVNIAGAAIAGVDLVATPGRR